MTALTGESIFAATNAHKGHMFFDYDLQPVQPEEGQWFCEVHVGVDYEGGYRVSFEELVEYVGEDEAHTFGPDDTLQTRKVHLVAPEHDDAREPDGAILVLQI